ncbi:hypothetical protein [Selenomonas sp. KH1T6]|uniref:hypothetical protein n=1 Tax=Selenomonas sp. KH1T6 TaxID=3158784 RepID=UPI0008A743BF|nr:hypothetical protein SAMN05216583_13127 [Selenomonas ruminantium]
MNNNKNIFSWLIKASLMLFIITFFTFTWSLDVEASVNKINLNYTIMPYDYAMSRLKNITGNWYDSKGNLVLTINNGYINGCKVMAYLSAGDAGGYRIKEENGYRDIGLVIDHNNYKKFLYLDERIVLRPTKYPQYVESINGMYLGMSMDDLLEKYGEPDRKEKKGKAFPSEWWIYNGAFSVFFVGDMASTIVLPYGSTFTFDKCGLSARDMEKSFRKHYKESANYGAVKIDEGEYIEFKKGTVELTVYN